MGTSENIFVKKSKKKISKAIKTKKCNISKLYKVLEEKINFYIREQYIIKYPILKMDMDIYK